MHHRRFIRFQVRSYDIEVSGNASQKIYQVLEWIYIISILAVNNKINSDAITISRSLLMIYMQDLHSSLMKVCINQLQGQYI
ncbi:hypothetical protein ACET3Z_006117 [Daucus carota]